MLTSFKRSVEPREYDLHAPWPCCMSMEHVHPACPHAHDECRCCLSMLNFCVACPCCLSTLHVHTACPRCRSVSHVCDACPCCMSMLHVKTAFQCCIYIMHGHSAFSLPVFTGFFAVCLRCMFIVCGVPDSRINSCVSWFIFNLRN